MKKFIKKLFNIILFVFMVNGNEIEKDAIKSGLVKRGQEDGKK